MKARELAVVAIILGAIDVGIPYLLFRNVSSYWINYLFWSILTLTVLLVGILKIRNWGEK